MNIPEDRPFTPADARVLEAWQWVPVQARVPLTLEGLERSLRFNEILDRLMPRVRVERVR